ncbi:MULTISPECIES: type VI secretion system baseplate subunit TssE [unclassified Gilliamella]|uniref:type VI secretion system baseplate subunit TssE n=1 Tax=unclassified Gilliamella TaxID=2685620 RepID=UPI00080E0217|nr:MULTISPECIES: type VI secretion system baseplate subunit TssE [Gilliamella]MCX8574737.1 type VI secretion system baseplate subunit TssE [Gilliamella sp. B3831]MCX8576909.1 type VI secretion system baseplate subunit TssE [Gilliamella sp. B3815]MCX8590461.1 type VI secretion system baseplate subunit TssE [Gilliamella sp. B3812]MCX8604069.1 type VI secretion system baseplate subunit TssE [Gilliamella sp. B3823]MCX8605800.1 type VI secretion system baseplate subunit TssE [Gilliamella sp. B3825]
MSASLYDILYGYFESGIPIDEIAENEQTIISVMDNIERILNSRAGAINHMPDYGLPDMSTIFQALPSSAYVLMRAIEQTLLIYEPRLESININIDEKNKDSMVLSYELVCYFKEGGLVKYGTYFMPDGKAQLRYTKKTARN